MCLLSSLYYCMGLQSTIDATGRRRQHGQESFEVISIAKAVQVFQDFGEIVDER